MSPGAHPLSLWLDPAPEPGPPLEGERVGWPGREGIYTAHKVLESFRLTADDRVLGGSRCIAYSFGGRLPPDDDPEVSAALTTRRRIPMPPEPIRWLVAKGIMRGLAALDRRTDSRAQPRAGKEPAALEEAEREPAETV